MAAKSVTAQALGVVTSSPLYRKRITERWGREGGDTRDYYIGLQDNHGWISVGNQKIEFDKEVFLQIGFAIQELTVAQIEG